MNPLRWASKIGGFADPCAQTPGRLRPGVHTWGQRSIFPPAEPGEKCILFSFPVCGRENSARLLGGGGIFC